MESRSRSPKESVSPKKQPRLLQMMLSTQSGGAETFFEKLAAGFAAAGVPQMLVTEPEDERTAQLSSLPGVEVRTLRFGGFREPFAQVKLKGIFREFRPDIALTWMNRASRRVPKGLCPVVGRLGGYYKLKHYQNCDHLVGITPDLVAHITGGGWPAEQASLIPNFGEVIDEAFDAAAARRDIRTGLNIPMDMPLVLALGRLHEVKAHDTLIRALALLERPVALMIAGSGPLLDSLQALAASLRVSDRVHFLGWRKDIGQLFAASDISVFPSRYEPNGTVVMESWAHEKPLIASRAAGPSWLVDPEKNGLFFEIDSVDELAEQMQRVIDSPDLVRALVAGGREKFNAGFTREAIVQEYLNLFGSLL